jgi:hypothetical protein
MWVSNVIDYLQLCLQCVLTNCLQMCYDQMGFQCDILLTVVLAMCCDQLSCPKCVLTDMFTNVL